MNPAVKSFIYGREHCRTPGESMDAWQIIGYFLAIGIVISAIQWFLLFIKDADKHTTSQKIGLFSLVLLQFLGAYILFNHCKNCDCWAGFWKGIVISVPMRFCSQNTTYYCFWRSSKFINEPGAAATAAFLMNNLHRAWGLARPDLGLYGTQGSRGGAGVTNQRGQR